MLKVLVIESFVLLVLVGIIVFVSKCCRKLQEDNNHLSGELGKQKANALYLIKHAEELKKIETDGKTIEQALAGAKDEEEVMDIINTIVATNNKRVRNKTKSNG